MLGKRRILTSKLQVWCLQSPQSHCVVVRLTSDKKPDVFILLIFKNLSVSLLRSPLLEVSALVSVQMNT